MPVGSGFRLPVFRTHPIQTGDSTVVRAVIVVHGANRNPYALRLTEEGIRTRLVARDVVYMVGTEDTGDSMLDVSCGAMLQGFHRYARGLNLFAFMNAFYPQAEDQLLEIVGVGHSSRGMYQSTLGRRALFEW